MDSVPGGTNADVDMNGDTQMNMEAPQQLKQ